MNSSDLDDGYTADDLEALADAWLAAGDAGDELLLLLEESDGDELLPALPILPDLCDLEPAALSANATFGQKQECVGCRPNAPDPDCCCCGAPAAFALEAGEHWLTVCGRCWECIRLVRSESRVGAASAPAPITYAEALQQAAEARRKRTTRTKRCKKCGERKPLSDFPDEPRNRDGCRSACRTCANDADRRRRRTSTKPRRLASPAA